VKIGVITTSYPRHPGDPAGNFVAGHVEALRALGHRVDVFAAGTGWLDRALFDRGGAPDLLERSPIRGALAGAAYTAQLTAAVAVRAPAWDSIIAHWLVPSALAALTTRAPLLAIAHGGDIHTLRRTRLLAPTLHALRARGARLAFVSEQLRAIARAEVPALARWLDDAIVQPMGIALARFRALDRAPTDPPAIVTASRLVAQKGIDVAIAAMAHVRSPARLVIAGDGPERAALAARSSPHVTFLGAVPTEQRDQLLRAASLVVVPSRVMPSGRTEGTPLIAIEALAAGVPVVASSVGGLCELEALALVAPDDPIALARAIDRTLAAPPAPEQLRSSVAHLDWMRVATRLVAS
jgi:glycosyltransferase involved in cell wall biosynthesis